MKEPTTYKCDAPGCTSRTTDLSGWLGVKANGTITIKPLTAPLTKRDDEYQHYCGYAHALQAVSKAFEQWQQQQVKGENREYAL